MSGINTLPQVFVSGNPSDPAINAFVRGSDTLVYNNADQAIAAATLTLVNFNTIDHDDLGIWNTVTNKATIQKAGLYFISTMFFPSGSTAQYITACISKNGLITNNIVTSSTMPAIGIILSFAVRCVAGDILGIYTFSSSTCTLSYNVSGSGVSETMLNIIWMGY